RRLREIGGSTEHGHGETSGSEAVTDFVKIGGRIVDEEAGIELEARYAERKQLVTREVDPFEDGHRARDAQVVHEALRKRGELHWALSAGRYVLWTVGHFAFCTLHFAFCK